MYTSGSTGTPKGVRVPHRQLMNWLAGFEANWPFAAGEVVGQKTTMAFAVSVKELFAGLLNGCPQVFLDAKTVQDTSAFVSALAEHRVSRLNLVPSHLDAVLKHIKAQGLELPALKMCVTAGEPLTAEVVIAFRELLPHAQLWNNYGCTELNDICYYDTREFEGEQGFVPIGRPIQNTRLYVLDRQRRLAPEGVPGELHVATAGISDGYHNLSALTEERYLQNWFGSDPSDRLYNTGDVVRHLPGGNLEYIGRWDSQVKVRGFRVDVRQVEKILGEFPGMGARAVVGDGSQLFAYYTGQQGRALDLSALREYLRVRLPEYMVPSMFIWLAAMPRLPNGKLDRRALTPGLGQLQHSDSYEAPCSDTERTLATIWSEVLELSEDDIGRQTHFFEIGGHSLSATRVIARVKERIGLEIGLSQVFELPRLNELAGHLDQLLGGDLQQEDRYVGTPVRAAHSVAGRLPGLLENKVVLVTGSSRGIGSATVRLLAAQGARVAINYVHNEARAQRVRDLINQEGGTAETFQADVTQQNQVTQLVSAVRARFERIDVLVSNAAIGFKIQPFVDYDWADFERKVTDELKSMFYLCQAVLPEMIERKNGSIIAVSSSMSKVTNNGYIAHGTAKAALDSFVRALANEVGPDGVRVNTVAPGLTLTDATAVVSHQQRDAAAARCPLRRNGLPRDVAGAVLFLASDLSQFMTGTYLPVDGGFTML
jgi:NAD(P)-dependent dehydrogenase (short-subunit alcohol dehydrogenase family)/acyl carrier protein